MIKPGPGISMRMFVTVDLRRYIPSGKAGAICNLSSSVFPDIGNEIGEDLGETVLKVSGKMNRLKDDLPGLAIFPYVSVPFKLLPFSRVKRMVHGMMGPGDKSRSFPPGFTNMGIIDAERLVFSGVNVTGCFYHRGCQLSAGLSAGFYEF